MRMKKVVTIGGGSGGFSLLRGLREFPLEITAVFTAFDSGGSAGVLRDEFGILPPGDLRRGLVALSKGRRSEILRDLFNFRFDKPGSSLHEHSFGNLFLTALATMYGDEMKGLEKASELLNIKGVVLPVSLDKSHVHAILEDGTEIVGETNIDIPKHNGDLHIKKVFLDPPAHIYERADQAIRAADLVVIGPGDLYSSLLPALCVSGMKESLAASRSKKVAVCNLMTKWGETNNFKASDMVHELLHYSGLEKFDVAICNTGIMNSSLIEAYAREKKQPMDCDPKLESAARTVVRDDFFSDAEVPGLKRIARHDSEKIAKVIAELS